MNLYLASLPLCHQYGSLKEMASYKPSSRLAHAFSWKEGIVIPGVAKIVVLEGDGKFYIGMCGVTLCYILVCLGPGLWPGTTVITFLWGSGICFMIT